MDEGMRSPAVVARPCTIGDVIVDSHETWRVAVAALLDRIEWVMPAAARELRQLLTNPPGRSLL